MHARGREGGGPTCPPPQSCAQWCAAFEQRQTGEAESVARRDLRINLRSNPMVSNHGP